MLVLFAVSRLYLSNSLRRTPLLSTGTDACNEISET